MKVMFLLYVLHGLGVTSRKVIPHNSSEFRKPDDHVIQRRLYGGTEAKRDEFPFMILLMFEFGRRKWQRCSGALVSLRQVLTSAHCVAFPDVPPSKCLLAGGNSNLDNYAMARFKMNPDEEMTGSAWDCEERRAKEIFIHPQYGASTEEVLHDIAIVKVEKPFSSELCKSIEVNFEKIRKKEKCSVVGWGMITSGDNYRLNVVHNKEVSTTSLGCKYTVHTVPLICLEPDSKSGTCLGDGGAPLLCNGKVVGVASHIMAETENCGNSKEEYFVEISSEKEWFDSVFQGSAMRIKSTHFIFYFYEFVCLWTCWDTFY